MLRSGAVQGGTETPSIPPILFAMPEGMTLRYDQPAPELADYISGYHVYAATGAPSEGLANAFLPGTANVRITLDAGPIAVTIGRRSYDPLPQLSLFGPTARAIRTITNGGVMIGFGISALGWPRLFKSSAAAFANRIVPLSEALGEPFAMRLLETMSAVPNEHGVKAALDRFLLSELGPVSHDEAILRRIASLLVSETEQRPLTEVASEWGIAPHVLRRLSQRHFGFAPKTLMMRARFLRTFLEMFRSEDRTDYSHIGKGGDGYVGPSHFLRDAHAFLGTTPKRFMAEATPFLDASLRARAAVLGAATQALHPIAPPADKGQGG